MRNQEIKLDIRCPASTVHLSNEQYSPEQDGCSSVNSHLAASDVKVKRGAWEDLKVKKRASRTLVDCQQVKPNARCRQFAGGHAVERVNFAVAEVLRRNGDALGESS